MLRAAELEEGDRATTSGKKGTKAIADDCELLRKGSREVADDELEDGNGDFIFPLVLHPDTSGMAHVIGMIDQMIGWLKSQGEEVSFCKYEDVAREWRSQQKI